MCVCVNMDWVGMLGCVVELSLVVRENNGVEALLLPL